MVVVAAALQSSFNAGAIERTRDFHCDTGKLAVKPGDFGCCTNTFRSFAGLARTGSALSNGSGDLALAFATSRGQMPNELVSPLFEAVIEATEEAILNALSMAGDMRGRDAAARQPRQVR